jgi:hypothetical protein
MAVRSSVLAQGSTAAGTHVVATVPANHVWLIKYGALYNQSGGNAHLYMRVNRAGGGTAAIVDVHGLANDNSAVSPAGQIVVAVAGDTLETGDNSGGSNTFWCSGSDLLSF